MPHDCFSPLTSTLSSQEKLQFTGEASRCSLISNALIYSMPVLLILAVALSVSSTVLESVQQAGVSLSSPAC